MSKAAPFYFLDDTGGSQGPELQTAMATCYSPRSPNHHGQHHLPDGLSPSPLLPVSRQDPKSLTFYLPSVDCVAVLLTGLRAVIPRHGRGSYSPAASLLGSWILQPTLPKLDRCHREVVALWFTSSMTIDRSSSRRALPTRPSRVQPAACQP